MRSGGFPCRFSGCDVVFQVLDQRSMTALMAGSAARSDHEVGEHGYHHVPLPEPSRPAPYVTTARRAKARPEDATA